MNVVADQPVVATSAGAPTEAQKRRDKTRLNRVMTGKLISSDTGVATFVGTPTDVRKRLDRSPAEGVVALTFAHLDQDASEALTKNVAEMLSVMSEKLRERRTRQSLEGMADILVDMLAPTPPSPQLFKEAAMLARARKAVLASGDWLSSADVARLAELKTRNPSAQPNKWKQAGRIFAINHGGVDYFPSYGLDSSASFRPREVLAKIIKIFADRKDGWGMAYWFGSNSSFLGGKRPQDLLASNSEKVMEAALDEVQGVLHG